MTNETKITCILGMHRSGTSLVARLVNLLGVYLGPAERMLEPRPDNPKGFWEHQEINDINDQILARFGGSYFSPPDFPVGWQDSPKLQDLRERASKLFAEEFANVPSWGWKDPRTCLTLAFWRLLLPQMQYVICVRNPADVAHSLHKRDGLTFARSAALWVAHLGSILRDTRGQRRVVLFYEDFMLDWTGQLNLLAQFVNGSSDLVSEEIRAQAAAFVDQELHHHSTPIAENLSHPEISVEAKALYLLLREHVSGAEQPQGGAFLSEGLLEAFAEQAIGATRRSKQRDEQVEELRGNLEQLEAHYEHLKVVHHNLETHRQKVERQLVAEQERAHELKVVREQLKGELGVRLGELSEAKRALQALEGTAQVLSAERDRATVMGNELRRQLDEIESSMAWKTVGKVRATKDFLIPKGTSRRKLYELGLGVLKNGRHPRMRVPDDLKNVVRVTADTSRSFSSASDQASYGDLENEEVGDGGERVTPDQPDDLFVAHLSIYHFACQFTSGLRVLDAGCGTGYGSHYFLEHGAAKEVYGIDISPKAISYCRSKYSHPRLQFSISDMSKPPPGRFDFVYSSNVLEHVEMLDEVLLGLATSLHESGKMIIAVPPVVTEEHLQSNFNNPYHLNNLHPIQWYSKAKRFFEQVDVFHHGVREGVTLDILNPNQSTVRVTDFTFTPIAPSHLQEGLRSTLTLVLVAARPLQRPLPKTSGEDSFPCAWDIEALWRAAEPERRKVFAATARAGEYEDAELRGRIYPVRQRL